MTFHLVCTQVDQGPGVADAPAGRLAKRRRLSDKGSAAAGVAQDASLSQQPTQPVTSWEAEQALRVLAASGPQKDSVTTLVAELAALAASVSPSSIIPSAPPTPTAIFCFLLSFATFAIGLHSDVTCTGSGSGTLSTRERLHMLRGQLHILGWGCTSLRQVLTQALQSWLASEPVPAATANLPGMDEQMLILGMWPVTINSAMVASGYVHVSCCCYHQSAWCCEC